MERLRHVLALFVDGVALNTRSNHREKTVRNCSLIYVIAALIAPCVCAKTVKANSTKQNEYLSGTVLQVKRHEYDSASNYVGNSPSDAPLHSDVYVYDIFVSVNCATYVGRYESVFDYLPSLFTPNQKVEVRLRKHVMQIDVPGEERYTMGIIERPRHPTATCGEPPTEN
jgi:hypothetical protein